MKVGFHPVADNPVRMGYVPGWRTIGDLTDRLGDLEHAVGESRVIPAPWEPDYPECPRCRFAGAYAWARQQLANPAHFATALALFPGEAPQRATRIGHALHLILSIQTEPSQITRKLMLTEALELWESQSTEWLAQTVARCAALGVETSVAVLRPQVQQALEPLAKGLHSEDDTCGQPGFSAGSSKSHGFDKELLQMDGWTPDPGAIILPVDGRTHSLSREILLLNLHQVVLLRARRSVRVATWNNVALIHLIDGAVTFELAGEPPISIPGYLHPEKILQTVQDCYRAATERLLQSVATKVTRPTP